MSSYCSDLRSFLFLILQVLQISNGFLNSLKCLFLFFSDRLVRLWRVTGSLDEQLNESDRSVEV